MKITSKQKIDTKMLEGFLKEKRLDGMELASSFNVNNSKENHIRILKKLAKDTNSLQTIGIDSHRQEDFVNFITSKKLPEKTTSTTAQLITQAQPDLMWSNYEKQE